MQAIFVFSFIKYTPLVYANTYHYPGWGYAIGWLTGVISMMWIPAYALYYLFLKSRVDSPMVSIFGLLWEKINFAAFFFSNWCLFKLCFQLSIRQRFFYGLRPPQEDFPLDEKKHGENATIQCISISPDEKSWEVEDAINGTGSCNLKIIRAAYGKVGFGFKK